MYEIIIEQDDENPRDYETLGRLFLQHRRYSFPEEITREDLVSTLENDAPGMVVLPVYGYDHSGFSLSTKIEPYWFHYNWDGGQLGYIVALPSEIKKHYGCEDASDPEIQKQVIAALTAEVAHYNAYLNGSVFSYYIYDDNGDLVDSCGGYYNEAAARSAGVDRATELQNPT